MIAEGKTRKKFGNGFCNECNGCNGCQSDGRRKKEEGRSNKSKGFTN
ncbi:hypothetical protein QUA20_18755 [Microcoleus sp. Pol7_A1]